MQRIEETKVHLKATPTELTKLLYETIAEKHQINVMSVTYDAKTDTVSIIGLSGSAVVHPEVKPAITAKHLVIGSRPKVKVQGEGSLKGITPILDELLPPGHRIPLDVLTERLKVNYPFITSGLVRNYLRNLGKTRKIIEIDPNVFKRD